MNRRLVAMSEIIKTSRNLTVKSFVRLITASFLLIISRNLSSGMLNLSLLELKKVKIDHSSVQCDVALELISQCCLSSFACIAAFSVANIAALTNQFQSNITLYR